jgi:hypothetical protein
VVLGTSFFESFEKTGSWAKRPKLARASNACPLRAGSLATAVWRREVPHRLKRLGEVPAIGTAQVVRLRTYRSSGARVVGRLQKLVSSIFSARSRGAARQTERTRSSSGSMVRSSDKRRSTQSSGERVRVGHART